MEHCLECTEEAKKRCRSTGACWRAERANKEAIEFLTKQKKLKAGGHTGQGKASV
jgi:hypothetical protein